MADEDDKVEEADEDEEDVSYAFLLDSSGERLLSLLFCAG